MSTIAAEPDTESLLSEAEFRERLRELPLSVRPVAEVPENDALLSQGQFAEGPLLPDRTVHYTFNRLEESDLVGLRHSFKDT